MACPEMYDGLETCLGRSKVNHCIATKLYILYIYIVYIVYIVYIAIAISQIYIYIYNMYIDIDSGHSYSGYYTAINHYINH